MSDKCRMTIVVDGGASYPITIPASLKDGLMGAVSDVKNMKIRDADDTLWLFNFAKVVSIKVEDIP